LEEGVYRIVETQPPLFISSASSVGTVLPSGDERGVETDVDQISEIRLALGDHGIDYNFGEVVVPDKRMFLARTDMREILASQRGVAARTINGTSGDDTIVVEPVGDALRVTVNNQAPQQIPLTTARILYLNARGGQDTVEFRGAAGDEVANLSPGTGAMRLGEDYQGLNYAVMAVAAEHVMANGGGGDDLAVLRDSPASDELVAAGNTATLTSVDNRLAQALAFERVRALSEVRPGATDQDTANVDATDYVLETVGKWQLI